MTHRLRELNVPKQKPKQKRSARKARPTKTKPTKTKTAKALKPSKRKSKATNRIAAKASARKPAKVAKSAKTKKPAKLSKSAKPAKVAKQAKTLKAKAAPPSAKRKIKGRKAEKRAAIGRGRAAPKLALRESIEGRPSKTLTEAEKAARLPVASPRMQIGLLGGSFNPAHAAHVEISLTALKRLGLDQVWWIVAPSNPLKHPAKLPSLSERVASARRVTDHPRIAVTGFPGERGSPYTVDLIAELKRRYPGVKFVWLMGADNLAAFNRWRSWQKIFETVPVAVLDRPGSRMKAHASQAATRFHGDYVDESDAPGLARMKPPAWTIITHRLSPLSSTALRGEAKTRKTGDKTIKKNE